MNVTIKDFLEGCVHFLSDKSKRGLFLLGILGCVAAADFFVSGLARRTLVFYSIGNGKITVEDRMLKRSPSREQDISRYVGEAILGSALPGVLPLFPRGTRLRSLLLRDGVVYADFSEEAALPPEEGGDVFTNFRTLYAGIRRNFSVVKDVRFFIMGKAAFFEEFRKIFDEESKKRAVSP
jgi:hypothetical protein